MQLALPFLVPKVVVDSTRNTIAAVGDSESALAIELNNQAQKFVVMM